MDKARIKTCVYDYMIIYTYMYKYVDVVCVYKNCVIYYCRGKMYYGYVIVIVIFKTQTNSNGMALSTYARRWAGLRSCLY